MVNACAKDGSVPVIEFYHTWSANPGTTIGDTRNFHLTQAANLPAGNYRLVISAFYREGKGDGTSKAIIMAGTQEKAIRGLLEGEIADFSGSSVANSKIRNLFIVLGNFVAKLRKISQKQIPKTSHKSKKNVS